MEGWRERRNESKEGRGEEKKKRGEGRKERRREEVRRKGERRRREGGRYHSDFGHLCLIFTDLSKHTLCLRLGSHTFIYTEIFAPDFRLH